MGILFLLTFMFCMTFIINLLADILCFDLNLSLKRNHAKSGEIGSFILDAAENYGMENYLFIATTNLSMLLLFL